MGGCTIRYGLLFTIRQLGLMELLYLFACGLVVRRASEYRVEALDEMNFTIVTHSLIANRIRAQV